MTINLTLKVHPGETFDVVLMDSATSAEVSTSRASVSADGTDQDAMIIAPSGTYVVIREVWPEQS